MSATASRRSTKRQLIFDVAKVENLIIIHYFMCFTLLFFFGKVELSALL